MSNLFLKIFRESGEVNNKDWIFGGTWWVFVSGKKVEY